jgi:hypothetical protein
MGRKKIQIQKITNTKVRQVILLIYSDYIFKTKNRPIQKSS